MVSAVMSVVMSAMASVVMSIVMSAVLCVADGTTDVKKSASHDHCLAFGLFVVVRFGSG